MTQQQARYGRSSFHRTALAPGLLAGIVAVVGVALVDSDSFVIIRYVLAIMALVIAWFTFQARQWWWLPILLAIAVVWNPVVPFEFTGPWWLAGQYIAALGFIIIGIFVKVPTSADAERPRRAWK
ncbi:DUF6804 family protein [uncultured Schumannella sp.]|uniref:DUF6804 family protein n=1 Tax=uncultured Schumannella sp. TaxID=1195956 RepID=UPI0025F13BC0|nr:DUF6804 family protein [uncultured Schumannella sp.]